MSLLSVKDLTVDLDTNRGTARAVRNVSFELDKGETLGIVGESGCGKSMTALALMGLLPEGAMTGGSIGLEDRDLLQLSEKEMCRIRGNRLAMVFQEPMTSLNPVHTIGRQLAEPLMLHRGLNRHQAYEEAVRLLQRVDIPNAADRFNAYPHQISGGQRQRVMIAIALSCEPDILIADEPTTALDVTIQGQILDLINQLVDETGMSLILISHDLGVIAETVDRIMVMYGGAVVEEGASDQMFRRLLHPYSQGLFAAIPRLGRQYGEERLQTIAGSVPELLDLPPGCPFSGRCSLGDARCASEMPALQESESGHFVACHQQAAAARTADTGITA